MCTAVCVRLQGRVWICLLSKGFSECQVILIEYRGSKVFFLGRAIYYQKSSYWVILIVGNSTLDFMWAIVLRGERVVITSGTFFEKYPRHDTLISINKRNTGQKNKEFNLRHDWNSLISDDETLQYRHYSKEMFPPRETMPKVGDSAISFQTIFPFRTVWRCIINLL